MMNDAVGYIRDAVKGMLSDKKTLVKVLSVGLILLIAVVMRIHDSNKADITVEAADAAEEFEQSEDAAESNSVIYVDIGGAVADPGVYQVARETRLYEVIDMAGGLSEDADTDSVNRASFVEDGQKIIIPVKGSAGAAGTGAAQASAASDTGSQGLININTASADELKTLNGIGDVMAERIIEYRSSNTFKSKEDIMSVNGIGSKMFEKIRDRITV